MATGKQPKAASLDETNLEGGSLHILGNAG